MITSPDRALKTSDFKSIFATGFFLIFKSIVADRPSKTKDILEFPSSIAKILFDSSILTFSLFEFKETSTFEKYLEAFP